VSLELVFLSIFLVASIAFTPPLHAQAVVDATIAVRMIDAVHSTSDPAGKRYRASVTKTVDAANGVVIAQGSAAVVTLAKSGSGWSAQLSSVSINGQPVAVASSPASVTSAAQNAAGNAMNAMNSVLGGFGHHVNVPTAVSAVATGQRVVLPPGTTLTFVLTQPLELTSTAAPLAPASQAAAVSAPPAANPASGPAGASAGGHVTAMDICFATTRDPTSGQGTMYLTAAFEVPADTLRAAVPVFEPAFSAYLKATYQYTGGITCQPIWSIAGAQQAQKKLADLRDRGKPKVVDTGWRYGEPSLAQGQSGFDPLAQGPGGLDLSQHRLTTYYCTLDVSGGTTVVRPKPYNPQTATRYLSPLFQADWDSAPVSMAYKMYIRDHYVHDLDPTANLSPTCSAQSPAMQTMAHQTAMVGTKLIQHVVPVDFTYTSAQASEARPASAASGQAVPAAPAAPTTPATSSTGTPPTTSSTGQHHCVSPVDHKIIPCANH
jgi:hypothetical protein